MQSTGRSFFGIAIVVLAALSLNLGAGAASADPGDGSTGGAGRDPRGLRGEELTRSRTKEAELRRWLADQERRGGEITPQVHLTYRSGAILGYTYQEDQASYAVNWCGPGSTAGVVAAWNAKYGQANEVSGYSGTYGSGAIGYMKYLAYNRTEVKNATDGNGGNDITWWTGSTDINGVWARGWLSVTNELGPEWGFYVQTAPQGQDDFNHKLAYDVAYTGVPMTVAVWTAGLEGWNRGLDHFANLWAFNIDTNWVQWSDSAGPLQSCQSCNSFGYHTKALTTFYTSHVVTGQHFAW